MSARVGRRTLLGMHNRAKRLVISLMLASTVFIGPLSATAHAESVRCRVLRNYMENKSPDSWMWRAASVEYGNYC